MVEYTYNIGDLSSSIKEAKGKPNGHYGRHRGINKCARVANGLSDRCHRGRRRRGRRRLGRLTDDAGGGGRDEGSQIRGRRCCLTVVSSTDKKKSLSIREINNFISVAHSLCWDEGVGKMFF